jgi:hypothetical protein
VIITPLPDPSGLLLQEDAGFPRSKGLHMSEIYNDFHAQLNPKKYGQPMADSTKHAYYGAGFALEASLEEGLKARLSKDSGRPGEFVEPEYGIIYSPDLIIFNGVTRLGEIKLTWMSNRGVPREKGNHFPPKFDKYLTQMKLYCRCLETPYARLYAYFVNGNWDRKNMRPEFLAWDIEFTKRELNEEWSMAINHAKDRGLIV